MTAIGMAVFTRLQYLNIITSIYTYIYSLPALSLATQCLAFVTSWEAKRALTWDMAAHGLCSKYVLLILEI